jgi:hypothetical protein
VRATAPVAVPLELGRRDPVADEARERPSERGPEVDPPITGRPAIATMDDGADRVDARPDAVSHGRTDVEIGRLNADASRTDPRH